MLPAASESPLFDQKGLDPPKFGTGPSVIPLGGLTPGQGPERGSGQASSPALVVENRERPTAPPPAPLKARHARGDKTVPQDAIQMEFAGRPSFVQAMLDHARSATHEA